MMERRKTVRNRTYLGGQIAFNQRSSTMDCLIRNFAPSGAKLIFNNTAAVPDQFDVTIHRKERSFRARMIWRRADEAGVAFIDQNAGSAPIPIEWARRVREAEADKAALRRRIEQLSSPA